MVINPLPPDHPQRPARVGAPDSRARLPARDVAILVGVMLLWSLCYPLIATGVRDAPPLTFAAMRAALAGAALIALAAALGRPRPRGGEWASIVGIGLTTTTLGFGGMFLSGGEISPGLASVLASTQPLLAAGIGRFALGEPLRPRTALAMGLGFVGIVVASARGLAGGGSNVSSWGVAVVLASALGVACGNVLMKRLPARADALWVTGCQLAVGAVPLALMAGVSGGAVRWSASLVLSLLALALLSSALGYVLWLHVLRRVPLNQANTFNYLTPAFGLLIAAAFYGEALTSMEIAGSLLVLGAGHLASFDSRSP